MKDYVVLKELSNLMAAGVSYFLFPRFPYSLFLCVFFTSGIDLKECTYQITIFTGSRLGAGTDGLVTLVVEGKGKKKLI